MHSGELVVKQLSVFVLLLLVGLPSFGIDTTGVGSKISVCYKLNKMRDIKLIANAKELLPIAVKYPNSDLAVRIYTLTGRGFMNNFQYDSSKTYFSLAEQNISNKVSPDAKGKLMMAKGWYLAQSGEEGNALNIYLKAYDYFVESKDSLSMAGVLGNLASLMDYVSQYEKGLMYQQKALDIYKLKNDTLGVLLCLNNIGTNYMSIGKFNLAIDYFYQSIRYGEEINYQVPLITIYANLGDCFIRINKFNDAEKIGNSILRMNLKSSIVVEAGSAYLFKAFACSNRNEKELALSFADSCYKYLRIEQDVENIHEKIYCYKLLGQVYSKYKIFDRALQVLLKADTLLHTESESGLSLQFAKMENDFQLKNSKSEIESLKALSESQRILVQSQQQIIGLVVAFIVVFVIAFLLTFYLFRKSKRAEKEIQAQNILVANKNIELNKQNELQLMTIGIIGHDLRSPLGFALTMKQLMIDMLNSGQTEDFIKLATLHFDSLERIHVLVNDLVKWVLSAQSGINIKFSEISLFPLVQKVSGGFVRELNEKNIEFINEVLADLIIFADAASVETILRNVLQNAIKFTPEGKKITILSAVDHTEPNFLKISIIDEGIGMQENVIEKLNAGKRMISLGTKGEKGNGLGLIMIQSLLNINYGKMKIESEIEIGTTFSIYLPVVNMAE